MNVDKCHLLITNNDENISTIIDGKKIVARKYVKLLGIKIDNKLNFEEHITDLCKKANLKLHALARISNFMGKNKLRVLLKTFIKSQLDIAPYFGCFIAEN